MSCRAEISELLSLSARLGRDPLLVQASSGNTSVKLDGTLWIKASGKWMAHSTEQETLIPVALCALRANVRCRNDFSGSGAWVNGHYVQASIETAMHAILPHPVVIHVHSVNTISWAVRLDGPECLAERLAGLRWSWIPYVSSGLPLARVIEKVVDTQPGTSVFVLANHGLVVCGESCAGAEDLLAVVERRLAVPVRTNPDFDYALLSQIDAQSRWKLPDSAELHALCTDAVSRRILGEGILYPCQAIFLGPKVRTIPDCEFLSQDLEQFAPESDSPAFGIIEGRGVATNRNITASQRAVLNGLLQVVQRIDVAAPIRYLSDTEVLALLNEDAHRYQLCTERNAVLPKQVGKAAVPSADHSP